ncbi:MAG: hypothetical protein LLF76_03000 [Planctomycetaceae bacterium]|nr:hypothetical protein [Planctomycetaceae bacterium]
MEFLNREQILAASALKTDTVDVPELGGKVMIQEMTAAERDSFEASQLQKNGKNYETNFQNLRAKLIVRCVIDAQKKVRLFTDDDAVIVGQLPASKIDKLFSACQRLNGLSKADVEELAKNSVSPQTDSSGSD